MTAGTSRPAVVAWSPFQARSECLAHELSGAAHFIAHERLGRRSALVAVRYVLNSLQTWRVLDRTDPSFVVVIAPPVFASLVVALWCRRRSRPFAIDCHTEVLNSRFWRLLLPLQRWAARRAAAVTFHTQEDTRRAAPWTDRTLYLPDGPASPDESVARRGMPSARRPRVVLAGSLDSLEPVAQEVETARLLPDVDVVVTGDLTRVPLDVR
ncbi:MAG: hypothetical protein JOZ75_13085, partial [Candidatus Dormibacteraeota bacterium]|nr:hypothetical protein [Candidatus Dormibacteraeota bacterium]